MKPLARLVSAASAIALAACETTGNPREGGLFGWSENKAQERQARKQSHVTVAEANLTSEAARGEPLQVRDATAAKSLAAAETQRIRTEERLRTQQDKLLAKIDKLEQDSPTDATASRARSYRLKVNTIVAQKSLTPQKRAERLHVLEAVIDAAQARLK